MRTSTSRTRLWYDAFVGDVGDLHGLAGDGHAASAPSPLRIGVARSASTSSSGRPVGRVQVELLARLVVLVDRAAVHAGQLGGARDDR